MRDWLLGTREGEVVSMAIASDGSYDVPAGLIYSFPVTCAQGEWKIVQGLLSRMRRFVDILGWSVSEFSRKKLEATTTELLEEKKDAGL
jgi:malate dehydrogenase